MVAVRPLYSLEPQRGEEVQKMWLQKVMDTGGSRKPQQRFPWQCTDDTWGEHQSDSQQIGRAPWGDAAVDASIARESLRRWDHEGHAEEIKKLEKAIAALPEGQLYDGTRAQLRDNITALKMKICQSKPLGAQVDSCKAAMARARKRMEAAHDVIQKASVAHNEAEQEYQRLMNEMTALELQMPGAQQQQQQEPKDSITTMNDVLGNVLDEMKASTHVNPEHVKEAEAVMINLVAGMGKVSELARIAAAQRMKCDVECGGGGKVAPADTAMSSTEMKGGATRTAAECELTSPTRGESKTRAKLSHAESQDFHVADMKIHR